MTPISQSAIGKPLVSLTALFLLGLAVTCDAAAEADGVDHYTNEGIQSCVAEIRRHADFEDASRVTHWVTRLKQRNLVELEIRIETEVLVTGDNAATREYAASCVTGTLGDLVRFRIDAAA